MNGFELFAQIIFALNFFDLGACLVLDLLPERQHLRFAREVAKKSIQKLIADGRIHPARIEEVVQKVKDETDEEVRKEGAAVAFELGLHDLGHVDHDLVGAEHLDGDRQVARDVVAERGHHRVVVRAAPFPEHIGQAEDVDRLPALALVVQQRVFGGALLTVAMAVEPAGTIFIRLIAMVVVPLVIASLFTGIASAGDAGRLGRLGGRTLLWFGVTTGAAAAIGVVAAAITRVGIGATQIGRAHV